MVFVSKRASLWLFARPEARGIGRPHETHVFRLASGDSRFAIRNVGSVKDDFLGTFGGDFFWQSFRVFFDSKKNECQPDVVFASLR